MNILAHTMPLFDIQVYYEGQPVHEVRRDLMNGVRLHYNCRSNGQSAKLKLQLLNHNDPFWNDIFKLEEISLPCQSLSSKVAEILGWMRFGLVLQFHPEENCLAVTRLCRTRLFVAANEKDTNYTAIIQDKIFTKCIKNQGAWDDNSVFILCGMEPKQSLVQMGRLPGVCIKVTPRIMRPVATASMSPQDEPLSLQFSLMTSVEELINNLNITD